MEPIDPRLSIAGVTLAVSDLPRSSAFYGRVLGMPLLAQDERRALLGPDRERPALELRGIEQPQPLRPGSSGLFHVAWLHPDRASLADTVRRVVAAGWGFDGASDHGVSEALYLSDPDGLGIELYADRPRELWQRPFDGHGVVMVTEPLDIEDLLAQWTGPVSEEIDAGTVIGHVHLKVSDVAAAAGFYATLGFEEQARLPSAAFLSAGGYHHHVGLNSWQSRGGAPAGEHEPGLRRIDFRLGGGAGELLALQSRASVLDTLSAGEDGTVQLRDPDSELLAFAAAP